MYNKSMNKFGGILNELKENNNLTNIDLSKIVDTSRFVIGYWISNSQIPTLEHAIKLANYFNCSLDFLFGLTENNEEVNYSKSTPFHIQLKKILDEKKISQNKLMRETNFKSGNLYSWFNKKSQPNMATVIELAQYLNVSLDYLAGRE